MSASKSSCGAATDEHAPEECECIPVRKGITETITPDSFLAKIARVTHQTAASAVPFLVRPGDTVGRFEVREEIGRGGMGIVYAAIDPALGREVALKVLLRSNEDRTRRFLREARAAAAVGHAGAVAIYEVGVDENRALAFITMERIRGVSLRARLEAQPIESKALPTAETLRVALALARALAKAHAHGLVHRDLKPENVMLADDGRVLLLDFGLVKSFQTDGPIPLSETATTEGTILGTPSYMSPEQAKGRAVDARSDIFSFGVMLYEMATGQRPFVGETAVELFIAIDRDEPLRPSRICPDVDARIERVVLRCLRKEPQARYSDGSALLAALEQDARRVRRTPKKVLR